MGNITSQSVIPTQADKLFKKLYTLNNDELNYLFETLKVEHKRYAQQRINNVFTNEQLGKLFYSALVEKQKIISNRAGIEYKDKIESVTEFLFSCKKYFFVKNTPPVVQKQEDMTEELARKLFHIQKKEKLDEVYLKKQFRKLALKYHPDRPGGDTQLFEHISDAYMLLIEKANMQKEDKQFYTLKEESRTFREDFKKKGYQNKKMKKGPKGQFDVQRFNSMFQENRVETVEDEGYADWMKKNKDNFIDESEVRKKMAGSSGFNDAFSALVPAKKEENAILKYEGPKALYQGGELAVELGVQKINNFGGKTGQIEYTDLREAHSGERMIDPNQVKQYDHKNVDNLKKERINIRDYSEEEWSKYQQALLEKEKIQEKRNEFIKKQDELSAKRYDSIHSRMLENVWR